MLAAILGGLCSWAPAESVDNLGAPPVKSLQTIVVTAKRVPETVPDEVVQIRVETALHDDPYFYGEHVTLMVKNGVVHLRGIVFDAGDIQDVRRIIRKKVSGAKRVVNELEICTCDGGG
jgi:osmotically-inducible protein OsmY